MRNVRWADFFVTPDASTGFDKHVHFPDTIGSYLQFPGYEKMFHGVSASLGLTYQVSDQISIKANMGTAYRAPNITELASNGLDPGAHIIYLGNRNFNPEFSFQQDVGASTRLKGLSADISLFNNFLDNYIYLNLVADENGNPVVDAQENKTYQYEQSSAQLYGAEMWFSVHPAQLAGFRIDNSLS